MSAPFTGGRDQGGKRRWRYADGFVVAVLSGVAAAVVFTFAALIILIIQGTRPFEDLGVSVGATIALYFEGFLAAGVIAGIANPLARSLIGAIVLGIIAVIPITLGANFLLTGHVFPGDGYLPFVAAYPVLFGGGSGVIFWKEFVKDRGTSDRSSHRPDGD